MIARPLRVRIRARKPCLRLRLRLFGWNVRFISTSYLRRAEERYQCSRLWVTLGAHRSAWRVLARAPVVRSLRLPLDRINGRPRSGWAGGLPVGEESSANVQQSRHTRTHVHECTPPYSSAANPYPPRGSRLAGLPQGQQETGYLALWITNCGVSDPPPILLLAPFPGAVLPQGPVVARSLQRQPRPPGI
jgi:hypothetical protein